MGFTQTGRLLSVTTPLGTDALLLESFTGSESLSQLFEFRLSLLSEMSSVDPAEIVGKDVAIMVNGDDGPQRTFHGFVRRFASGGLADGGGFRRYEAVLVPWMWFLTKRSNCRIFQEKSVVEVIEAVFEDAGFADYVVSTSGTYPPLEYCVQYRESDFDFVSRLMEEVGIFYFFRFDADRHVLVLADSKGAYNDCDQNEVEYAPGQQEGYVTSWEHRYEFVAGKYAQTDYDFASPDTDLYTESPTVIELPGTEAYELFDYPGGYADKGKGQALSDVRMEAEEANYDVVEGTSTCVSFHLAGKFVLNSNEIASEAGKDYVLTSISHSAKDSSYQQSDGGESFCGNRFTCIPSKRTYRPPLRTPRPLVNGPQTAIVVGPKGEEIYTDEYGRIKVQFHWDRRGDQTETSSCWVRVSQRWAGEKWGTFFLPRIGQEVIVDFLEGDPDRPIVTGAVYNGANMPINDLPAKKTQSGIKTRSSKSGGADRFNEIRFEDKKGSEHIFIHAQKDMHERVVNDLHAHVGNDAHRTIAGHRKEAVGGDAHLALKGDDFEKVGGSQSVTVGANRKVKVASGDNLRVGGDLVQKVGGDHDVDVMGSQKLKAGMNISREAGMDVTEKAGMNYAAEAGLGVHIKGGMNVVIEAGLQLTLKAGAGFVTIGPAGVDISGPLVKVNSGGAAGSGSGCSPESPGAPTAPDAPVDPVLPMEKQDAGSGKRKAKDTHESEKAEAKWAEIENASPTPQAAALQEASDKGQPFCAECEAGS